MSTYVIARYCLRSVECCTKVLSFVSILIVSIISLIVNIAVKFDDDNIIDNIHHTFRLHALAGV